VFFLLVVLAPGVLLAVVVGRLLAGPASAQQYDVSSGGSSGWNFDVEDRLAAIQFRFRLVIENVLEKFKILR